MSPKIKGKRWNMSVSGPPVGDFRSTDGPSIKEALVLVAWIDAPRDKAAYLKDHGVELRFAEFDSSAGRWERCLLSRQVADMLLELGASGEFPHPFEARPSEGELEWLRAQAKGATIRPVLPLYRYLVAASKEEIEALNTFK